MANETSNIQGKFTAEEWDVLCCAPISIFCLVAGSDGNIDKKEFMAFAKMILGLKHYDHELIKAVYAGTVDNIEAKFNIVVKNFDAIIPNIKKIRSILKGKVEDKVIEEFCKSILFISVKVASASGGFLGFGAKISKEEKEMLVRISTMLDLEGHLEAFIKG